MQATPGKPSLLAASDRSSARQQHLHLVWKAIKIDYKESNSNQNNGLRRQIIVNSNKAYVQINLIEKTFSKVIRFESNS